MHRVVSVWKDELVHADISPLGVRAAIPRCHVKQQGMVSYVRPGTQGHLRSLYWSMTRIRIPELECCVLGLCVVEFAFLEVEQEVAVVLHLDS